MSNRVALVLTMMILGAVGYDYYQNDGEVLLFLARKALDFLDYVIFWR